MLEQYRLYLQELLVKSKDWLTDLGMSQKIILGTVLLSLVGGVFFVSQWKPEKRYETAFSNLTQEDEASILAYLKKSNVKDFRIFNHSLAFPEEQVQDMRMQLALEGLPAQTPGVGWEKFDERAFGMTEFDQKINRIRAIQGELARTINRLEPVENSRVHIVMPETHLFQDDKKVASASISLRLKSGRVLSHRQIQGILHLSAKAVEGLDPSQIAIIDQDGNMLTQGEAQDMDPQTFAQREYTRRMEKEMESKIRDMLSRVVGQDKVVARVQLDVDFKKVETTIQDVDPDRTVVLSSQKQEQSSTGQGLNPTGVPGAKSNLPNESVDIKTGGMAQQSSQNQEVTNFEFKKTMSKITEPVGNIKKLSASVLVDNKLTNGKSEARSAEELAMLTKLVKNAIGFQDSRDALTLETAQFEKDEMALMEVKAEQARKDSLLKTIIINASIILGLILAYFALFRPYFKWLTFDPTKRNQELFARSMNYNLERSEGGQKVKKLQVKEEVPFEQLSHKEQIMFLAKSDPVKTSEALRQVLSMA